MGLTSRDKDQIIQVVSMLLPYGVDIVKGIIEAPAKAKKEQRAEEDFVLDRTYKNAQIAKMAQDAEREKTNPTFVPLNAATKFLGRDVSGFAVEGKIPTATFNKLADVVATQAASGEKKNQAQIDAAYKDYIEKEKAYRSAYNAVTGSNSMLLTGEAKKLNDKTLADIDRLKKESDASLQYWRSLSGGDTPQPAPTTKEPPPWIKLMEKPLSKNETNDAKSIATRRNLGPTKMKAIMERLSVADQAGPDKLQRAYNDMAEDLNLTPDQIFLVHRYHHKMGNYAQPGKEAPNPEVKQQIADELQRLLLADKTSPTMAPSSVPSPAPSWTPTIAPTQIPTGMASPIPSWTPTQAISLSPSPTPFQIPRQMLR